jgi:phosphoribosylamine--glycine ligase
MLGAGIPTARAEVHTAPRDAKAAARRFGAPVVIKASGLAAGKGVVVCTSLEDAERTIDDMLAGNMFGDAGHEVLVEEFMAGEELSMFVITDGRSYVALPGLQDHKRLLDGDRGPNTGGMGAYLPVSTDPSVIEQARSRIIGPTLDALAARGSPFTGLLYAGLMVTTDGPKVVEFNCRFGDPETQALMPALGSWPLLPLLRAVARGERLTGFGAPSIDVACVTTVLAAAGYPDTPRTGDVITLPPAEDEVVVFHAGTKRDAQGRLVTAGGRVLAVSAVAPTVGEAQRRSLAHARRIGFGGKQLRSDIGWREVRRGSEQRTGAGATRD